MRRGACFPCGMALTGTDEENALSHAIIGAGIKVHRAVGPGLFEKPYRVCLVHELRQRGYEVREEVAVPLIYEGVKLDCVYRLDLVVNESVIVELKTIESITETHVSQMLTYLRLTGLSLGILMNFRAATLKDGIRRVINTRKEISSACPPEFVRSIQEEN